MVFTLLPQQQAQAASFPDVSQYKDEITYLTDKKIINGYSNGTFGPDRNLTRLQAVTMILREKGITDFTAPNPNFTDMEPGKYGYAEVAKAVELGFIGGKTAANGSKFFDPSAPLTRGQMSKILAEGYKLTKTKDFSFTDVSANNGFKDHISALASQNITTGYGDGSFKPNQTLSRQHFAVFMARMLDDKFKPAPNMQVHSIDVGQGDSILVQTPNGKNMLIDGGTKGSGTKVVNFLKSKGVSSLDVVVATHPDADHIGGLIAVLNSFKVNQFIDSGKVHTTQTYYEMLQLIDDKNIPFKVAKTGDKINLDSLISATVLHADENAKSSNDASIVTRIVYGSVSFLLTGDAETAAESKMVSQYGNSLKSTYLKAGHHGSNSSSTTAFINAVKPTGTILSYGKDNSYGHPHAEVVKRLNAVNSKIYSTAQSGNITVTTDGKTHSVSAKQWTDNVTPKPQPKPEPKPEPKPDPGLEVKPGAPSQFNNCTEMRKYYPNGVKKGHPAYASKHDRDADGWACEPSDNGTVVIPKPEPPKPTPKPDPKPQPPKPDYGSGLYVKPGAPTSFKNCTELRKVYPQGVKRGHPAYATKHDRDKDGWACE